MKKIASVESIKKHFCFFLLPILCKLALHVQQNAHCNYMMRYLNYILIYIYILSSFLYYFQLVEGILIVCILIVIGFMHFNYNFL